MTICPIPEGSLAWSTDTHPAPPPGVTTARAGRASTLVTASQEHEAVPVVSGPGGHTQSLSSARLPAGLLTPQFDLLHLKADSYPRDTPSSPPATNINPLPPRAQLSPEC